MSCSKTVCVSATLPILEKRPTPANKASKGTVSFLQTRFAQMLRRAYNKDFRSVMYEMNFFEVFPTESTVLGYEDDDDTRLERH